MRKDIHIPEVSGVEMAIVFEYNDIYKTDDWNVYIINNKEVDLETILIVTRGYNDKKISSVIRKKIDLLPKNSFAKVELIQPELFALTNEFQVTFFSDNQLFEKTFVFEKDTVKEGALRMIKSLNKKGILKK